MITSCSELVMLVLKKRMRVYGFGGGGGMRRKRHHTLLKIINRLSADALSGEGSRTAWNYYIPCMDQLLLTATLRFDRMRACLR
jgi:hypothetical protein